MGDFLDAPRDDCELTDELIKAAFPAPVADDASAMPLASEAEVLASLEATLDQRERRDGLWVFGYGSLMWRPELEAIEERLGDVAGLERSFCLWQWRYRGSRASPGLRGWRTVFPRAAADAGRAVRCAARGGRGSSPAAR